VDEALPWILDLQGLARGVRLRVEALLRERLEQRLLGGEWR
jgi:hypothetical protein